MSEKQNDEQSPDYESPRTRETVGRLITSSRDRTPRKSLVAEAGLAIQEEDAFAAKEVGYVCRALVQATLPYREPKGSPPAWGRTAGKVSLVIQPGYYLEPRPTKVGTRTKMETVAVSLGYPYGSIPRLLLAWIGREVTLHKKREIVLGASLSKFMAELGMNSSTGGKNGSITRLRDQMRRTFSSKIAILDNPDQMAVDWKSDSFQLVDKTQIWWDGRQPHQGDLFESAIVLSERFYEELRTSPVPVDMRALRALKGSPSCLDLYSFLTYRAFNLRKEVLLGWELLQNQFGSEAGNIRKFKWQFQQALKHVITVYPQLRVDVEQAGLRLKPSPTSVRQRIKD